MSFDGRQITFGEDSCEFGLQKMGTTFNEISLIHRRVRREITKMNTTIGIIGSGLATSAWQVGGLGIIKWVLSDRDLPGRREDDLPWYSRNSSQHLADVEVIFVEGTVSIPTNLVNMEGFKIVINARQDTRLKPLCQGIRLDKSSSWFGESAGWLSKVRQYVFHEAVGGATNGRFWLETWARPDVEASWSPPKCIRSTLGDAIDPTLRTHGRPWSLPHEGQIGSF